MSEPRPPTSSDLRGRVAVVTGGSRGLGRAMAEAFATAGATVVVASRKLEACQALADELSAEHGVDALGLAYHSGEWESSDSLHRAVLERFGRIDVLVNNAGMSPLYESLPEVTEALWDKVLDVNLRGPFRLTALTGATMAGDGGGSIINVSSVAAVQPSPSELPYAAAKAGLNTLTLGFARAFGPTVRVNCIMPGPFMTDVTASWDLDAFAEAARRTIPLQRGGEPHEIVGAALYLAGDASSYTTGAIIKIDGGTAWSPG